MTASTPLITARELAAHLGDPQWRIFDCRHDLTNPAFGELAFAEGHIPGAQFVHLDRDLSGPKTGRNGRHPLPDRDALAARLRGLGLRRGQMLVAYDGQGGMYAARLWWLARWLGHDSVAVLDGGLPAWQAAGLPVSVETPATPAPGDFAAGEPLTSTVDAATILGAIGSTALCVIDARAGERYRGETEPMDPVAGHIPGALNRPFAQNLRPDGRFKPAPVLRAEFAALLAGRDPAGLVHQCGSGVTACHNLLAMSVAQLPAGALYPGSWSEWCADPARPVARGEQP